MFKKVLIAAAIVIASPAFVSAQDIIWSFSPTSKVTTFTAAVGSSGTAYIFSDALFGFDVIDLDFTSSDLSVLQFTGGQGFNPTFTSSTGGTRFDASDISFPLEVGGNGNLFLGSGNLFSVNVTQNGVDPSLSPLFDPGFVPGVGVLLAEVDFGVVSAGAVSLDFSVNLGDCVFCTEPPVGPSLGSASLIGVVPEPSSLALLIMGSVGLVACRRRT